MQLLFKNELTSNQHESDGNVHNMLSPQKNIWCTIIGSFVYKHSLGLAGNR